MMRNAVGCVMVSAIFLFASSSGPRALAQDEAGGMKYPLAIAVKPDGEVFVADRNLPGIWKIKDSARSLYFQASPKFRTPLNAVRCLAVDGRGFLLAGDSATREVYRFDEAAKAAPLTAGGIGIPMGIAVTKEGDLLVSDAELHCIWKVAGGGGTPVRFAGVPAPRGVCLDGDGSLLVVSGSSDAVVRVDSAGKVETVVAGRPFQYPHAVTVDTEGRIYVSDGYSRAIWRFEPGQAPQKWVEGPPLMNPVGIAWLDTSLLIVDPRAKRVFRVDSAGKLQPLESPTE